MALLKSFGRNPTGITLELLKSSIHYKNGIFENLAPTKMMTEDGSFVKTLWKFMNKPSNCKPAKKLPSIKTDLHRLDGKGPVLVWFGHSSYLIRVGGKNLLVDPVFSGHASPFSFGAKSFDGSDIYSVEDMPAIDILLITHDHYDHLDYQTFQKLQSRVKFICTSIGVASHLIYWGMDASRIKELDWGDSIEAAEGLLLRAAPARHFSGRSFTRCKTFWSSFILETKDHKIYIGGDSGYDGHFKSIGEQFGPFDLVILESGQYNASWPLIHMMPQETVLAAIELKAKLLLPVHWGKFSLSLHPWDEPPKRVQQLAKETGQSVSMPQIGELLDLGRSHPEKDWWSDCN